MNLEYIDISGMSRAQIKELERDMKRSSLLLESKLNNQGPFDPEIYSEGPLRSFVKIMKMFDDALLTRN